MDDATSNGVLVGDSGENVGGDERQVRRLYVMCSQRSKSWRCYEAGDVGSDADGGDDDNDNDGEKDGSGERRGERALS